MTLVNSLPKETQKGRIPERFINSNIKRNQNLLSIGHRSKYNELGLINRGEKQT